jgi:hypothetical protein
MTSSLYQTEKICPEGSEPYRFQAHGWFCEAALLDRSTVNKQFLPSIYTKMNVSSYIYRKLLQKVYVSAI